MQVCARVLGWLRRRIGRAANIHIVITVQFSGQSVNVVSLPAVDKQILNACEYIYIHKCSHFYNVQ